MSGHLLRRLLPAADRLRHWSKLLMLIAALACLMAAAARPRWGVYFPEVRSRGVDVFVLLDVSRSMLADGLPSSRRGQPNCPTTTSLVAFVTPRRGVPPWARTKSKAFALVMLASRPVKDCRKSPKSSCEVP